MPHNKNIVCLLSAQMAPLQETVREWIEDEQMSREAQTVLIFQGFGNFEKKKWCQGQFTRTVRFKWLQSKSKHFFSLLSFHFFHQCRFETLRVTIGQLGLSKPPSRVLARINTTCYSLVYSHLLWGRWFFTSSNSSLQVVFLTTLTSTHGRHLGQNPHKLLQESYMNKPATCLAKKPVLMVADLMVGADVSWQGCERRWGKATAPMLTGYHWGPGWIAVEFSLLCSVVGIWVKP